MTFISTPINEEIIAVRIIFDLGFENLLRGAETLALKPVEFIKLS